MFRKETGFNEQKHQKHESKIDSMIHSFPKEVSFVFR